MRTENLVRASADIVRITNLEPGDVYRRLIENLYGGDKWTAVYGIVQGVDFNGADTMVTAIEFSNDYAKHKPALKVFGNGADMALFSATPVEVSMAFDEIRGSVDRAVEAAHLALAKARAEQDLVENIIQQAGSLSRPKTVDTIEGTVEAEQVDEVDEVDEAIC